ncbi:hypothetical protein JNB_19403 [Janibacter sp. HTCC2649]|nr:hypothetical protein JNB_19403 [Janibacter sp. HTCC2649]
MPTHADDGAVTGEQGPEGSDDQMPWIGGVLIDAAEQGRGVGRAAMVKLLRWLFARPEIMAELTAVRAAPLL